MNENQKAHAAEIRTKPTVEAGITVLDQVPGRMLIEYQPGNGTRYVLMFTHVEGLEHAERTLGCQKGSWLVADCLGRRHMAFIAPEGFLAPHYFSEKTGFGMPDSVALCEMIGHVLSRDAMSVEEWIGQYVE